MRKINSNCFNANACLTKSSFTPRDSLYGKAVARARRAFMQNACAVVIIDLRCSGTALQCPREPSKTHFQVKHILNFIV